MTGKLTVLVLTFLAQTQTQEDYSLSCGEDIFSNPAYTIGGVESTFSPWAAALGTLSENGFEHECSGSVLSASVVITAAHCLCDISRCTSDADKDKYEIRAGKLNSRLEGVQKRKILRLELHPEYDRITFYYDVVLIMLNEPFELSPTLHPICLPAQPLPSSRSISNWGLTVQGWVPHSVSSYDKLFLNEIQVIVRYSEHCDEKFYNLASGSLKTISAFSLARKLPTNLTDTQFCAESSKGHISPGDSGGPAYYKDSDHFELVGIVSGSFRESEIVPGIYVFIADESILDWIKSFISSSTVVTEEDSRCEDDRECVQSDECEVMSEEYKTDRERLLTYRKEGKTNDYETLKKNLRNLICNKRLRKICCRQTGTIQQSTSNEVMLITGGYTDGGRLSSVEIFDPSNPSLTCSLPNMTVARSVHAAVGLTVCGGYGDGDGLQTCETLVGQQWTESHRLQQKRVTHVIWQSPSHGVMVMGGWYRDTWNTTERLQDNSIGWRLQHDTAEACSIDLGQSVVITGGFPAVKTVTQYHEDGQHKELPQLNTGRHGHGCSSYVRGNNVVLLVIAGYDGGNDLSSTEIQLTRTSEWKTVEPYPHSVAGLRGATINNVVYMTGGGRYGDGQNIYYDDEIYKYENDVWSLAGKMKTKRRSHAVSVVKRQDILKIC